MEWLVFVVVAVAAIGTALGLVIRPNPLHGALFLVGNLFCVAVLYLMLRAEFLALAQVIVYAGAIMVLFIFAIMLLIPGRAEAGPDPLARARRLALPARGRLRDHRDPGGGGPHGRPGAARRRTAASAPWGGCSSPTTSSPSR